MSAFLTPLAARLLVVPLAALVLVPVLLVVDRRRTR